MLKSILTPVVAAFYLLLSNTAYGQKEIEKGLTDLEVEGIPTYFTDLAISPDGSRLSAIAIGGRIYQFDASTYGKLTPVWNSLKGGRLSYLEYSADGKYLACKGTYIMLPGNAARTFGSSKKQATDELAVLDASNGNALLSIPRGYSIQVLGNTAFASTPEGFEWYSLPEGKQIRKESFSQQECAALSIDGSKLIVSFNPEKDDFRAVDDANGNRRELKVAGKYKRQILIYDVANLAKPLNKASDEVDIVFAIRPEASGEYVNLICSGADNQEAGNGSAKIIERFDLSTGKMDRSFGVRTRDVFCSFKFNSDNVINSDMDGMFGTKKQFYVRSRANLSSIIADFEIRQRFASGGSAFTPGVLLHNRSAAFIAYSKNIYLWDFALLPHFKRTAIEGGEEALSEKMKDMITASLSEGGSIAKQVLKQKLNGIYNMDITVGEKGVVSTVFCESDELTNIPMQNALKDIVRSQKFDVDIPKGRRIKFRYVFEL